MRVTVAEIVAAVKGKLLCGDCNAVIEHISIDSRSSEGNDIFVPIIGAKVDAHRFIGGAFEAGCAATLTSEHDSMEDASHAWIRVDDTVEALHEIGRLCRSHVRIPAVGVTGSVGKTTTREMIACALSAGKKVYKTEKNYNSSVGLPITMSRMSNDYDVAVLELGMNVPGELGTISEIAELDMAVITTIGVAHIEYFGSKEAICREKFTITKGFGEKGGLLILNGDDPLLYEYRESTGYPYVLYGTSQQCEYRAENIRMEGGHYCFDYVHGDRRVPVVLSVLGEHNVRNAVAALTAAERMGVTPEAAAAALYGFTGFRSRLERINIGGCTMIDDTYNASPDSMIAGVKVLAAYPAQGRRIAVLGGMLELGQDSPKFHFQVGEAIGTEKIDGLVVIGEAAANIGEGAGSAGAAYPVWFKKDNKEASKFLTEYLEAGDVVYLKASNGMHLKEIAEYLREHACTQM